MEANHITVDLDIRLSESKTDSETVEKEMERLSNALIQPIYGAGAATTQEEYEQYYDRVFAELARLDTVLAEHRYLLGEEITQADVRLYSVLVRFDTIYYFAFRLTGHHIRDYAHLWRYARELYHTPEFRRATDLKGFKDAYYNSQDEVANPYHLIMDGPDLSAWEEEIA